jgi:hypothetical protein
MSFVHPKYFFKFVSWHLKTNSHPNFASLNENNRSKWFISLIFASAFISSLDRGKSISCLKIKKISKFTIKDFENGLTCVMKLKIPNPRIVDNKKVRNVLQ